MYFRRFGVSFFLPGSVWPLTLLAGPGRFFLLIGFVFIAVFRNVICQASSGLRLPA